MSKFLIYSGIVAISVAIIVLNDLIIFRIFPTLPDYYKGLITGAVAMTVPHVLLQILKYEQQKKP